jgi:protein TonB
MGDALASIDTKTIPGNPDPLAAAASSRNAPAVPLPVGGEVKVAQLLKSVPPIYPPIARSERVSGKVQIDALIDTAGNVASVKVLSGPTILHRAAVDAVKQWKYKPATLDGEPTSMHLTVTLEFKAQ